MSSKAEKEFMALRLHERLAQVRAHGEYLASRNHGGHTIHLYRMEGFLCEVWMRVGIDQVEWIEIPRGTDALSDYVLFDPKDLLDPP